MPLRLFIAAPVPVEVKRAVERAQDKLRSTADKADVRWTRAEQMHLTLRFLGDVRSEQVERLTSAVRVACLGHGRMRLRAEGIGFFPNQKAPRVIWVGVAGEIHQLGLLRADVNSATAPFTDEPDEGDFRPHLTVARVRYLRSEQIRALTQSCGQLGTPTFGEWSLHTIEIIISVLSPEGSQYQTLATLPLGQ